MRKLLFCLSALIALSLSIRVLTQTGVPGSTRTVDAPKRSVIAQSLTPPVYPQARVDDALIEFPLPKGEEAYGDINGKAMHKHVVALANASKHYRDAGHPKFWGRLTGTSGIKEAEQYIMDQLTAMGATDVHRQPLDLTPQYFAKDWDATITAGGKTLTLTTAQPAYQANALPKDGAAIDAVYVGLGTEADFLGKDVKGKAVFIYAMQGLPNFGGVRRADTLGATAVFEVTMLPGNMIYQAYPSGTKAPEFVVGNDEGNEARNMIVEAAKSGAPAKVKVWLETENVPDLKSALVFGTLKGATDETIYITAHMDGWFEGAGDNAGGVAGALGIMAHFAKIPQAQRKRTMVFVGLDGHHNSTSAGDKWLVANKDKLFTKTALLINNEHPATIASQPRPRYYPGDENAWATTYMPLGWYTGGKSRPDVQKLFWDAAKTFGVSLMMDASPTPPASDAGSFYRFVNTADAGEYHEYFHTSWETPETVPWTALEATSRMYAKFIDGVNKMPLSALQRPEEPAPTRGGAPAPAPAPPARGGQPPTTQGAQR